MIAIGNSQWRCRTVTLAFIWFALQSTTLTNAQRQTIAEIISQRPDLSLVKRYLKGTDIFNRLRLTTTSYTFFVPNNNAFLNVSEQTRNVLFNPSTPSAYFNGLFSYHATLSQVQTSSVSATNRVLPIQSLAGGAPKLFLVYEGEAFINGARIVEANVGDVSNGILHIIDCVLYEPRVATNAYTYIHTTAVSYADPEEKTSMFSNLLNAYKYAVSTTRQIVPAPGKDVIENMLNSGDQVFMTAFVPHDQALNYFQSVNLDRYQGVLRGSDPVLLQKVIESHVIPSMPYHTNLLERLTDSNVVLNAVQGRVRVYRFNDALYVSNNCVQAKITKGNITALNGVVHMIDNLLGFVYQDAFTEIKRDTMWLYEFYGTVQASTPDIINMLTIPPSNTGVIPDSEKVTIFAPVGMAYRNNAKRYNDFSQDQMTLRSQMLQIMLPGVVEILQMANNTRMKTLLDGQDMIFYQYGDSHYVEVNYVRAKIIQVGVCVRNGIIHKVDEIVGVPCCTTYEQISFDPKLRDLREVIDNNAVGSRLRDMTQNLTLFAPIDFSFMRNSEVGLALISNRLMASRMRNLLSRHMVRGFLFLDTFPVGDTKIDTMYDRITLSVTNKQEYFVLIGTLRMQVLRANIRTKNGVMHIIDKVIFDPENLRTGLSFSFGVRSPVKLTVISFVGFFISAVITAQYFTG